MFKIDSAILIVNFEPISSLFLVLLLLILNAFMFAGRELS